jgi:hypothetical protein
MQQEMCLAKQHLVGLAPCVRVLFGVIFFRSLLSVVQNDVSLLVSLYRAAADAGPAAASYCNTCFCVSIPSRPQQQTPSCSTLLSISTQLEVMYNITCMIQATPWHAEGAETRETNTAAVGA